MMEKANEMLRNYKIALLQGKDEIDAGWDGDMKERQSLKRGVRIYELMELQPRWVKNY